MSRLAETVTGRINATPDVVKLIEDAVKRTQEIMRYVRHKNIKYISTTKISIAKMEATTDYY